MNYKLKGLFIRLTLCAICTLGASAASADGLWESAARLRVPRTGHTTTLLAGGEVLVVGGWNGGHLASTEIFDPETGAWRDGAPLRVARSHHTATRLPSGEVLVVGGYVTAGSYATVVEIWDPRTESWTTTGSPVQARAQHTATLLPSGEVLVAGGRSFGTTATTELWNPATGTWSLGDPMAEPREDHTATLTGTGEVLVAGGYFFDCEELCFEGVLAGAEAWDPVTRAWSAVSPLATARANHTATALDSGEILVVGGGDHAVNGDPSLASAEIWDPAGRTWSAAADLTALRSRHTAALLPSGEVVVVGGVTRDSLASTAAPVAEVEIWSPATGLWRPDGVLESPRLDLTSTLLPSGELLAVGGADLQAHHPTVELRSETGAGWQPVGDLTETRFGHSATLLPSGHVLVVSGATAELWDPETHTSAPTGALLTPRTGHSATPLPGGEVLVAGGVDDGVRLSSLEIWSPQTQTWRAAGNLLTPRSDHRAVRLSDGDVLFVSDVSAEVWSPISETSAWTDAPGESRRNFTATRLQSGRVLVAGGSGSAAAASAEIWDPATGLWTPTGALIRPRQNHEALLLPSGRVLLTGGWGTVAAGEIWDPATGSWQDAGAMAQGRFEHTATLLPSGEVLVTGGGSSPVVTYVATAEIWSPRTRAWRSAGTFTTPRGKHTATLLPTGDVLLLGGQGNLLTFLSSAELLAVETPARAAPVITATTTPLVYGAGAVVSGTGFRSVSEGGDGSEQQSAVDLPLLRLQSLDGADLAHLPPASLVDAGGQQTVTVTDLPPNLHPGPHLLTVVTAGIPSEPVPVEVACSLAITGQPEGAVVPVGAAATFHVETQGGRRYRWMRDEVLIPEATGPSYTTPPVLASDSGTVYSVEVDSGCTSQLSDPAVLVVKDENPPQVEILSPNGGEYWLLSDPATPNSELVTWTMSDDVRVCGVEVSLLFSDDGGATYTEAPAGGGLPASFGPGGACRDPGASTASVEVTVPSAPPSGGSGSLYKIRVAATDHAGRTTVALSPNPFFIVEPNPEAVRTLIVTHPQRMATQMGASPAEMGDLDDRLRELAGHPRVAGLVVDLASETDLSDPGTGLYAAWDADPGDAQRANRVLFGCHPPLPAGCPQEKRGVHDVIRNLLEVHTGVEYLVIVGDDRVVPLARVPDDTALLPESAYPAGGDLTAAGSTVGRALAAGFFLSDDPLAMLVPVHPDDLGETLFLPDLLTGRLVETPAEIGRSVSTFVSENGILDLSSRDPQTGRRVLVAGYDFLLDSARRIHDRWTAGLGATTPGSSTPLNGLLLTPTWDVPSVAERRVLLRDQLSGGGAGAYGVNSLNGHATHYEEGVPGADPYDIQGLGMQDLYGADACGSPTLGPLDLSGSLVYAVGCHGGLPVPGSCATDPDHSLDLPQTMLARGALAYLANTGYGWGLRHGIGYGERLVEIFTEELTTGGTVVVGEAVRAAKERYVLEAPRLDAYDEKTLLQWATFGFPMTALRTGFGTEALKTDLPGLRSLETGRVGHLAVTARSPEATGDRAALPNFLTRLDLHFDLSAPGTYLKRNAAGELLADQATPGCPDPAPGEAAGCYYTLNGLVERSAGVADLPIQPYFVFDSRLSGTSQHGVLWKGGTYAEEDDWVPLFAELASNGGADASDHGSTPRPIFIKPVGRRRGRGAGRRPTGDPAGASCAAGDLEVSSLVVTTGETLKQQAADLTYSVQRRHLEVDLEILYFNDTLDGTANCDRSGPELGSGPFGGAYHQLTGSTLRWSVPADDPGGVWRVLVVYTGESSAGASSGTWTPVELEDDGTGTWSASRSFPDTSRVTYVVQAVDRRGNVTWLDFAATALPASGVEPELPLPVDVELDPGSADLALTLSDAPDPVAAGEPLTYTLEVANLGPDVASSVTAFLTLPAELPVLLAGGTGWACATAADTVTCSRDSLAVGTAPPVTVLVGTPPTGGEVSVSAGVSASSGDDDLADNAATETTLVVTGPVADLAIFKDDGGAPVTPGSPLTYTIVVTNHGPDPVSLAWVTDVFPPGFDGVSWTCIATAGSVCTASGSGDIDDPVELRVHGTLLYTATGTVAPGVTGDLHNTATVDPSPDGFDQNPANNLSAVDTPVTLGPDPIFGDDFETGNLAGWSAVVP